VRGGLGLGAEDGRGGGQRGDHRSLDLGLERRRRGVEIGTVGGLEARDGGPAGPALDEVLLEEVVVGERDAAVRARGEQGGHAPVLGRQSGAGVAGGRVAGRADQQRLGIEAREVRRGGDAGAEAPEGLGGGHRSRLTATGHDLAVRQHGGATTIA
jgi:hypothetical protein